MCYKYATPKLDNLLEHLKEVPAYTIQDYYQYYLADGFNHNLMPITTIEANRTIQGAIWGLVPEWIRDSQQAKEWADKTLNAKSETAFELTSFKNYIGRYRCLIWVNGFYEWQWRDAKGKTKIPYFIYMPGQVPFTMGGVYTKWQRPDTGVEMLTFSIITTEANNLMSEIHNNRKRMPLIITPENRDKWLSNLSKEQIQKMMQPLPDGMLQTHTISKLITTRGADINVPEVQTLYEYAPPPPKITAKSKNIQDLFNGI